MSSYIIDVEADGPIPGPYSMISFGAVLLDRDLETTFYGKLAPISRSWVPEALAVSGHTRKETEGFEDPKVVLERFEQWLKHTGTGRPLFLSDNNGFDWMFMCWYFHTFLKRNPFGHSSTNVGSLFKGLRKNMHHNFKHLTDTKHTHHPVDDAKGVAEALLKMKFQFGLKIKID